MLIKLRVYIQAKLINLQNKLKIKQKPYKQNNRQDYRNIIKSYFYIERVNKNFKKNHQPLFIEIIMIYLLMN